MHPSLVPLPERLKDFPKIGPYIIPYVAFIGPDGTPDLKIVDDDKRRRCYRKKWCGICGQPLGEPIVFIGGPVSVRNRSFIDPAMHEECALYAAQVCPYLSNADADYSLAAPKHLGEGQTVIRTYESVYPHRPDRLALYYCRSYTVVVTDGTVHARANKPFKLNWDVMPKKE